MGDGPQRQELETLVSELNLGERLRLVGLVTDSKPYFEAFYELLDSHIGCSTTAFTGTI